MQSVAELLASLDSYISGHPLFIITLLGTGLFFTIYLKFPQIRFFKRAIQTVRGKHDSDHAEGDASHFQALATALSGTVGTGNIAGVALAIHLGGPAALFWMVATALIGMATKFVEVTLSHKYRTKLPDGTMAGGPMYYMRERLNLHWGKRTIKTGRWIAIIFSFCTLICAFGTGNLPQVNSISSAMNTTFGIPTIITGGVLALILATVVLGGIKRIVLVTEKLVPIMGIAYFVGALVVVIYHIDNLIPGLISVFADAFTGSAATGGFLGAGVAFALSRGVNRGLFSNEAGQGSAPIAHAAARCHEPVSEGLVALLEPFIDTVIVCTLTGMMIITSGVWSQKFENTFQQADIVVLDTTTTDAAELRTAINDGQHRYTGNIDVFGGKPYVDDITVIHAHSVAEDMMITCNGKPFSGTLKITNGVMPMRDDSGNGITITGKSLLHSAPLTIQAFASSWFGKWGKYIVTLSLLLFAFSTSIAWCYYGDRAASFIFGPKAIIPFRLIYVLGFFVGSFTDTAVVWYVASIGVVFMSMPNLIGILLLRKEMKQELRKFND